MSSAETTMVPASTGLDPAEWGDYETIQTGAEYIESLRGRNMNVYLFGERLAEPVDHPMIRPLMNAMAETYELALDQPEVAQTHSPYIDGPVNRFLHIAESAADLVAKGRMQRHLG
jgi:4-hydroxybutyryl-CoA dehydratase/vinylacetyl-CoA-Delta-isomerase